MELESYQVKGTATTFAPKDITFIVALGDIQWGTQDTDVAALRRMVDWAMGLGAYFIGLGDYVDRASPSNRERLQLAKLYDSVQEALNERAEKDIDELMEILGPTRGRWLGMVEGHHYWDFEDGSTTDTRLAEKLHAPFLGDCGMVDFHVGDQKITIWAVHGEGAGTVISSPLNALMKVAHGFEADVFLVGHHSKQVTAMYDKVYKVGDKLEARTKVLLASGAYMRGYTAGRKGGARAQGSYVEQRGLAPVTIGSGVLWLEPAWKADTGSYIKVSPFLRSA